MRPTLALAALLLGCVLAREVEAASLEVSPVIVTVAPGQTATTIAAANHGNTPTAIQARIYRWTQTGDEDVLTPTVEIIVSPPIFTVPDGGTQTIRLLLRGGGSAAAGQRTYRLVLDEVPPATAANRQVTFVLRESLPVFVGAPSPVRPALQWRAERGAGGETTLIATNAGPDYDKVIALDVTLADGSHPKVVSHSASLYVLSGDERHWTVQSRDARAGGPLHLSVTTLAGKSELTLTP
jgi:fimbrial chaperone protein